MKKLIVAFTVVLFVTSMVNGQVTVYTDRSTWEAAVVSFHEEFFDDATLNPGISSNKSAVASGVWSDQVSLGYPSSETWFSFDPEIYAFGGDWDMSPLGPGSGIGISLDGVPEGYIDGYYAGFWGIVSTEPFNTVLLQATSMGPGVETFELDNMVYSKPIEVDIDIKPGSCPNAFNAKNKGVIPVAIVGTVDFDVTTVDPETVTLADVSPIDWSYDDTTEPVENPYCEDCFDAEDPANFNCDLDGDTVDDSYCGDGYMDLILHFDAQALAAAIAPVDRDDCVGLVLSGENLDGIPIEGVDYIIVKTKIKE